MAVTMAFLLGFVIYHSIQQDAHGLIADFQGSYSNPNFQAPEFSAPILLLVCDRLVKGEHQRRGPLHFSSSAGQGHTGTHTQLQITEASRPNGLPAH